MYPLGAVLVCLLFGLAWQLRRQRFALTLLFSSGTLFLLWNLAPFPQPEDNYLLALIALQRPWAYAGLKLSWVAVLFLLPAYIWFPIFTRVARQQVSIDTPPVLGRLPLYPDPQLRRELFCILGELHYRDVMEPNLNPRWCEIPESALARGIMVLGSIGTGKTRSCLLPIADQIFSFCSHDRSGRVGGLVLEVKGDFCHQVRDVLRSVGRADDYLEIGFDSQYCYNPLHSDAAPTELAFRLMSVLRILQGHVASKDSKFWDEAAQGLLTFLIVVHRLLYGYVTLQDLYKASSSKDVVDQMMKQAGSALEHEYVLISKEQYMNLPKSIGRQLDLFNFDAEGDNIRIESSPELNDLLMEGKIEYQRVGPTDDPEAERRRASYESAKTYHKKLKELSAELRTNIAETINVSLQPFDMDEQAKRIFCPPKAAYDPVLNRDGQYGRPLPPLPQLVESPKVLAMALPIGADEKIARIAGVLLKQDWERAVLRRKGQRGWDAARARRLLLLIDEYHLLATAGGAEPDGDEKFLNLCRDVGCIPVVATQSLSSLRATVGLNEKVITQALQTTICLRQKDQDTAEWVSKMVGRKDILREHWGVSENEHGIVPSVTGGLRGMNGSMNMSRGWNEVRESIFEPQFVHELPDGVAIACVYDGFNQLPPTLLYLQQYGQDRSTSWFTANKHRRKVVEEELVQ